MPRLRRADCSGTGIAKRRQGQGFRYDDARGRQITDFDVLSRIEALVLPPAWNEVWICPYPNGHSIDPRVIELFQDGITISEELDTLGEGVAFGVPATQGPIEAAVVGLLRDAGSRRRVRRLHVTAVQPVITPATTARSA